MDEKISKAMMRKTMLHHRESQSSSAMQLSSRKAQQALLAEKLWQEARCVALYMPTKGEVQTQLLASQAWECGKKVFLPRCNPTQAGHMDFVACRDMHDLVQGKYGIWEPNPSLPAQDLGMVDMVLIPGLAFTRQGQRLGFGGGYYDRFLSKSENQHVTRVGMAFSWQILDTLPTQPWDISIQALVSDEGVLWI